MEEKRIIKYGLLGTGRGWVDAYCCKHPQSKLVAICDKNPDRIKEATKELNDHGISGFDCYSDFDEMLAKADIEAVIIATEATNHVSYVKKAMDAGKHVLSEIPAIATVEEAKELKEIEAAHPDLIYMCGENCCYWAFIKTWKKMRENGEFGDIVFAEAEYLHATEPSKLNPNVDPTYWRSYFPAIQYITHQLGPLLYIMDDRCVSVTCMEPDVVYNPHNPDKKAVGMALFKTAKGAVIKILICFGAYTSFDHNFRLCGTKGNIMTDPFDIVDNAYCYANLESIPGTFSTTNKIKITVNSRYQDEYGTGIGVGHGECDFLMGNDFIDCILENRRPFLDAAFGIRMALPGILAHESAMKGGMPIEIPEI